MGERDRKSEREREKEGGRKEEIVIKKDVEI